MEAFARPPAQLSDKKPMEETWKMWKKQFEIFIKAAGIDENSSEVKAYLLMNNIGTVGMEALENIKFDNEEDKLDFDILLSKLDEYFNPPKCEVKERFNFFSRFRKSKEPLKLYIADLTEKAKTCNFGPLTDSLIRDMIVLQVKDDDFRKIIFEEEDLDLNRLTIMFNEYERSTKNVQKITKELVKENTNMNTFSEKKKQNVCWKCGTSHPPRNCPAFKATCENCKEKGHFTQRCNKNVRTTENKIQISKNVFKQIGENLKK